MKNNIPKSLRYLKRYKEILKIFIKYGFSDIVNKISVTILPQIDKDINSIKKKKLNILTSAARLTMAFEESGATFIKLGQMLSLRADFVPPEYAVELSKLQDNVKADPIEQIRSVLFKVYGKPINEIFLEFDEHPIAAGSIAQVHKARLQSGQVVAVKILHPGIERKIESDVEILTNLARLIETHIPESKIYKPVEVIKEFGKTIKKELNLVFEANNIDSLRKYLGADPNIKIPLVYWDYSSECILVTEFIDGIKLSDIQKNTTAQYDPKQITLNAANSMMKQIFEIGIFHADPHPGNIFILPDNIVAAIDFGNVGRIDDEMRDNLIEIIRGIAEQDYHRIARVLMNIGSINEGANLNALKSDLMEFIGFYYSVPLNRISLSKLINEFVEIIREHQLKLPSNFIAIFRTLAISETVARELYPKFNLAELLVPYTEKAYLNKFNTSATYDTLVRTAEESFGLIKKLPENLQNILNKISDDKFSIILNHKGLEELTFKIDCAGIRLSLSIIIAGLILGLSIIMTLSQKNLPADYPIPALIGLATIIVLCIRLIIGIKRSGG